MPDKKLLEKIIENTLETVSESKEQIFEISEQSRLEYIELERELAAVRIKVAEIIEVHDDMRIKTQYARNYLAEVSRDFHRYTQEEVQRAYEQANDYRIELAICNREEKQLRERRDQLERRLLNLEDTVKRAEHLAGQMNIVHSFLSNDLKYVGEFIQEARVQQAFGLRIIEAQEEERKKLSRDIHDGPAQMLANVLLRSELIERVFEEKGVKQALIEISELRKMVRSSLEEVRRIIYDLRPMALDDLGLIPTLSKYLLTFEERYGLRVNFRVKGRDKRLPHHFEVAIFRLVQEAIQNILKHAEASEINVRIEVDATKVIIVIKDDGKGFDPQQTKEESFGLLGMKERAKLLRGKFEICSRIDRGTTIYINIPLE